MRYPEPSAVGGFVDHLAFDANAAHRHAEIIAGAFIVVAGNEDHLGAALGPAQNLLHQVGMRRRPVPAALQAPAIDDVADEIEGFEFHTAEKSKKGLGLASPRAQMNVGNPERSILPGHSRDIHDLWPSLTGDTKCCRNSWWRMIVTGEVKSREVLMTFIH